MATYREIADHVRTHNGKTVKTCWIAHVKELNGLRPNVSARRYDSNVRTNQCPPDKRPMIEEALRAFGMIR